MISKVLSVVAVLGLGGVLPVSGAISLPTWAGDPNTTSQTFLFDSSDLTPAPNNSTNPYGTASASVTVGLFGNGWEDPVGAFSNPGHEGDGAWDVGPALDLSTQGIITFDVPVAPGPPGGGTLYRIDLVFYAIAYKDLAKIPEFSVAGLSSGDIQLESSGILSTQAPAGTWEERTWSAVFEAYSGDTISMALTPPEGAVSVVDRVDILTRYTAIPEPSVSALLLGPLVMWGFLRRRS